MTILDKNSYTFNWTPKMICWVRLSVKASKCSSRSLTGVLGRGFAGRLVVFLLTYALGLHTHGVQSRLIMIAVLVVISRVHNSGEGQTCWPIFRLLSSRSIVGTVDSENLRYIPA